MLTLNALLGLGTALAPAFVAIFVGLGFWWGLPVLSAVLLTGLLVMSLRLPLRSGARDAGERAGAGAGIPSTVLGLRRVRGPVRRLRDHERQLGAARDDRAARRVRHPGLDRPHHLLGDGHRRPGPVRAPSQRWFPTTDTYHLLPFVLAAALVAIALLPDGTRPSASLAFGLAGLGCSALLPLTISFGQDAARP